MVNNSAPASPSPGGVSPWTVRLVAFYVAVVAATVIALAILTALSPAQATDEAWGHALIASVFAVLLPLRLRAARRGNRRAHTAIGIIAIALFVVNVVEAVIPGFFPIWMRIEMSAIAALMAVTAVLVWRNRQKGRNA